MDFWPGTRHENPFSTRLQVSAQPSPGVALPSSQASPGPTTPSPQTMVETQGCPGVSHLKYFSTLHVPEQPSPGLPLPSSHSSGSGRLIDPSPQAGSSGTSLHCSRSGIVSQMLPALPPTFTPVAPVPTNPP